MKYTFVAAVGLCLLFFSAHAQDHGLPGYIVRVSGDTVRGFLREQGTDESAKRISFKTAAADNDYQVFLPSQVKAYQYDGGNLFRALTYSDTRMEEPANKTCYAKLLVSGEFDLYYFTEQDVIFFLVRKDSTYYLIYDDDLHALPAVAGNFRNELNFFAVSCEAAKRELVRIDYTVGSVMGFFQKLDACVNPGKSVTSYYHKAKGKVGLFAYAGGIPLGQQSQFTAEFALRMVWPELNPNISFNLGVRYASVVTRVTDPNYTIVTIYHAETYQIKSLPLTVQYNIAHGVVQPFVLAGFSLLTLNLVTDLPINTDAAYYHKIGVAPLVGGGVDVRLVHWLRARAEWRYEYMSQYPTVGAVVVLP
jgi:hypothetical protein